MAGNCSEGLGDDFFEQILAVPENNGGGAGYGIRNSSTMGVLQLGGGSTRGMPLGLNLEQTAFLTHQQQQQHHASRFLDNLIDVETSINNNNNNNHHHLRLHNINNTTSSPPSSTVEMDSSSMQQQMRGSGLFSTTFGQMQHTPTHAQPVRPTLTSPPQPQLQLHHQHLQQQFQSQAPNPSSVATHTMPQPPGIRPRVRARRGQATDPHSIAERLRRERIAERMRALQELVPSINKTDKAVMLDEIVDYVKFLRLQVKVLSMSRLGGAGAVAQLVADVPAASAAEGGGDIEGIANQEAWAKWSSDGTEEQVAKLMEEDVGAAMQFLQSKALCIMPISLASAIFRMPQSDASTIIKPESNNHS